MATGHSKWFSLIYMLCCADSLSYVWLFATPWTLPGSSVYGDSLGQNTGVGCHALLQGLFPTQGSNPGLLHCRWWVLYRLSHQRNPRILEWVTYPFSRKWKSLTPVQLFATLWTVACQAPLSMEFSRPEYWNGLPFPSPGHLPKLGIKPESPALQIDSLPGKPSLIFMYVWNSILWRISASDFDSLTLNLAKSAYNLGNFGKL